jgi:hypothetical protein
LAIVGSGLEKTLAESMSVSAQSAFGNAVSAEFSVSASMADSGRW